MKKQGSPFSDYEKGIAHPPDNVPTAVWGERHRELSILTSARAGKWNLAMVPFMKPLLDWLDDEDVESVCLQKSTQIAGTETFLTWLARVADQDPGPAMVVFADEDTAREICDRRIQPMFRSSPPIAKHIDEKKFNKDQIQLLNNFSLTMAWASSIGKTASRPIRFILMDEICKPSYGRTQDEGSVIRRIEQRAETFPNKKIVKLSTVTIEGDNMDKEMLSCDVIFDWHLPCPFCGAFQPLRFRPEKYRNIDGNEAMSGSVVWVEDPDQIKASESARYQCGECKALWTTSQKNAAVALGLAVPRSEITSKPKHIGFHISRIYSLFSGGRLESLVSNFLRAKNDPLELQSFINNSLAQHWKPYIVKSTEEDLAKSKCPLPPREVPAEASAVVITVDMQQSGFWYVARAWNRSKTSWLLEYGNLEDWEDLEDLIFERTWQDAKGRILRSWRVMIDSGGSKEDRKEISRTEELYHWYGANRLRGVRLYLCKGSSHHLATKLNIGKPMQTTPSGKKIENGLRIVELNTSALKDEFFWRIGKARDQESNAAYLHCETEQSYYRQILAEARGDDGLYKRIGSKDNHYIDCEMMQMAAICDELKGGIRVLRDAGEQPHEPPPQPAQPQANPFTQRGTNQENPFTSRRR